MILVENTRLAECHFSNGMPMLPFYHRLLISKMNDITYSSETMTYFPLWKRFLNLVKSWKIIRVKRKKILIFSSTLFNIKKEDVYFNYIHGYYYNLYKDDSLLIEDGDGNNQWRSFKSVPNLSSINSNLLYISTIISFLCNIIKPLHLPDFESFVDDYPQYFTIDKISRDDYLVRIYSWFLDKLFAYSRPDCVFLNCASYGHIMSVITYVAKRRGIKVIEPQHGVTRLCPAYMASKEIVKSEEYQKCLPDALFVFGEYWLQFVDWNYEKYIVGSAYLNEYAGKAKPGTLAYDYLVVSQPMGGQQEEDKITFVKKLAGYFPDKKVLFRIHPSENFEEQKRIYQDIKNIIVSESTIALYDDINICKHIVGWYSNCLYEALAFGKNPVIVDTPETRSWMAQNIGIWVKDPSEMTEEKLKVQSNIDYTQYWAGNFEERVRKYIDRLL